LATSGQYLCPFSKEYGYRYATYSWSPLMRSLVISPMEQSENTVEVVERKGLGHPDTICDALAEALSQNLCRDYRRRFGQILHHNVDKCRRRGRRLSARVCRASGGLPAQVSTIGSAMPVNCSSFLRIVVYVLGLVIVNSVTSSAQPLDRPWHPPMRMILLSLSLVLATAAQAEMCRGVLDWDGIRATVGKCQIPIGEMHTQVTKLCHWGQSCEVRAKVIRGEITKIYSIPTARHVCTGNRLEVTQGTASIRSEPNIRRDPTSCWFKVDTEVGKRGLRSAHHRTTLRLLDTGHLR
jgi:hypothetical protein